MRMTFSFAAILCLLFFGCVSPQPEPPAPTPVSCTDEAKLCPDGSYVGRTGPKCEFSPCPPFLVGNDSDDHGCKASAGYSWCEELGKCVRPWEEKCASIMTDQAKEYCRQGDVYLCGDYVKVERKFIPSDPVRFYKIGSNETHECPDISPKHMTSDCRRLLSIEGCEIVACGE